MSFGGKQKLPVVIKKLRLLDTHFQSIPFRQKVDMLTLYWQSNAVTSYLTHQLAKKIEVVEHFSLGQHQSKYNYVLSTEVAILSVTLVVVLCSVILLCPTLCYTMDCSPPGSFVHGISQARILEWVAISFSRGSSQLRGQTHISGIDRQILYHCAT